MTSYVMIFYQRLRNVQPSQIKTLLITQLLHPLTSFSSQQSETGRCDSLKKMGEITNCVKRSIPADPTVAVPLCRPRNVS